MEYHHRWVVFAMLAFLTACTNQAIADSPIATLTNAATSTPGASPTPPKTANGWYLAVGLHFQIAYPPSWQGTATESSSGFSYTLTGPDPSQTLTVAEQAQATGETNYCNPAFTPVTLAGLPMRYATEGDNHDIRTWIFENAQSTLFSLSIPDLLADTTVLAEDNQVLSTFQVDNPSPFSC
jgi:hypothetical protein